MGFVTTNFNLDKEKLENLEFRIWQIVKTWQKKGIWLGLPHLVPTPLHIIEIQFYGDISDTCKSIWIRFSVDEKNRDFVENIEASEVLRELEEIVADAFDYSGIWEINKYFVQPLR